jgi:hypothetical protein
MSLRNGLLAAALVAVAPAGACAPMAQARGPNGIGQEQTALIVENNNWQDMALYLLRSGTKVRIGSVPSFSKARIPLSGALIGAGEIQLLADPIGSNRRFVTEPINVQPGQQVLFRLENNLAVSSYSVW